MEGFVVVRRAVGRDCQEGAGGEVAGGDVAAGDGEGGEG